MAKHCAHLPNSDLEDVVQQVWVAGAPDDATAEYLHRYFEPTARHRRLEEHSPGCAARRRR